jgi:hypothetical protein
MCSKCLADSEKKISTEEKSMFSEENQRKQNPFLTPIISEM